MKQILIYADWVGMAGPILIGTLKTEPVRSFTLIIIKRDGK
jgi:hypothetical protein